MTPLAAFICAAIAWVLGVVVGIVLGIEFRSVENAGPDMDVHP